MTAGCITNKCSSDYLWVHLIRNKTQTKRSVLEDLRRLRIALAAADTGKSANGDDLAFAVPFIKLVPKPNAPLLHCPALMAVIDITPLQGGLPTDNVKLLMQLRSAADDSVERAVRGKDKVLSHQIGSLAAMAVTPISQPGGKWRITSAAHADSLAPVLTATPIMIITFVHQTTRSGIGLIAAEPHDTAVPW